MLNRKTARQLKQGIIDEIILTDGYRLNRNEYNQVFISRGGKKKYYLSDKMLFKMADRKCAMVDYSYVQIAYDLAKIAKTLKHNNPLRSNIEEVINKIRGEGCD